MEHWKLSMVVGAIALTGVALGATLFGAEPAEAQGTAYRECIIARQESLDTNGESAIQRPDAAHTIQIPRGWEPIGGGGLSREHPGAGSAWMGAIVLCRR